MSENSSSNGNVNHPKHYSGSSSLECIDVMNLLFGAKAVCYFCLCNAFKYLWRHRFKNGKEDVEKALMYLRMLHTYRINEDINDECIEAYSGKLLSLAKDAEEEYTDSK